MNSLLLYWTRGTNRWLRMSALMLLAGILVAGTGCSWFKGGKKELKTLPPPIKPVEPTPVKTQPPVPAEEPDEGIRPGQLLPFPEMQVIYFDYDKDVIRADQLPRVENNLKYLLEHPGDKVMIEGHCDERGTPEYNLNLGQRRAQAVKNYYVKNGVADGRIAIVSKGKEQPVDPGHNEAAWAKNRRAEFKRMY